MFHLHQVLPQTCFYSVSELCEVNGYEVSRKQKYCYTKDLITQLQIIFYEINALLFTPLQQNVITLYAYFFCHYVQ